MRAAAVIDGARSITRADQLKGQRLAVSSLGSSSHFWAKYALKQLGLDGERDMAAIAVGSDLARLASLESGAAQASAVEMVTAFIAQKKGFPILIDLTDDKLRFLGASVVAQSGVIERQTDPERSGNSNDLDHAERTQPGGS